MGVEGIKARSKFEAIRKSKTYEKGRVCNEDGCDITMSMYNKADKCFQHSPKTFPRVRGHIDARDRA